MVRDLRLGEHQLVAFSVTKKNGPADTSLRQHTGINENLEYAVVAFSMVLRCENKCHHPNDYMLIEKAKWTVILYNGRFTLTSQSTVGQTLPL